VIRLEVDFKRMLKIIKGKMKEHENAELNVLFMDCEPLFKEVDDE
jgi:hypothetical protein